LLGHDDAAGGRLSGQVLHDDVHEVVHAPVALPALFGAAAPVHTHNVKGWLSLEADEAPVLGLLGVVALRAINHQHRGGLLEPVALRLAGERVHGHAIRRH